MPPPTLDWPASECVHWPVLASGAPFTAVENLQACATTTPQRCVAIDVRPNRYEPLPAECGPPPSVLYEASATDAAAAAATIDYSVILTAYHSAFFVRGS